MSALLAVVLVVLMTSAMCSLFEAVLYSVPLSHIESLVARGRPSGKILRALRNQVDAPITAVLSLNTISNTAGAALAGALASEALGADRLIWFSAVFTVAILLLAEVIPKTAGVVYSRPLSALIARPLLLLTRVFAPIIWAISFITRLFSAAGAGDGVSAEEILTMARLGSRTGTLEETEGRVIENALALKTTPVKDVLTPRLVTFALDEGTPVAEVHPMERLAVHSRFPVYSGDSDRITGLVESQDVFACAARGELDTELKELARPIHLIAETLTLDRALTRFLKTSDHLFGVIDEFGGFCGVVTLEDVLEELIGREIVDSSDLVPDMRELAKEERDRLMEGRDVLDPDQS